MTDGSVVVCTYFLNSSEVNVNCVTIAGRKYSCLEDAFLKPYRSSTYGIYVGSELWNIIEKLPASFVTAEIYAFPRRPVESVPFVLKIVIRNGFLCRCVIQLGTCCSVFKKNKCLLSIRILYKNAVFGVD